MGYASTTIAVFGIKITDDAEAAALFDALPKDADGQIDIDTGIEDKANWHRYKVDFLSDGTDSRSDSLSYDGEHYNHIFGVFLASNGYAYSDDIKNFIKGDPLKKAKEIWKKHCASFTDKKPDIEFLTQVW